MVATTDLKSVACNGRGGSSPFGRTSSWGCGEMADTQVSEACGEIRGGSSPLVPTSMQVWRNGRRDEMSSFGGKFLGL
jgi:hypothetical protein